MGFGDLIRNGVALANTLTGGVGGLQDTVIMHPWIGSDDFGAPAYGSPISLTAIIEEKQGKRIISTGNEVIQKAEFTLLRPLADNGAAERREPIDPRDKFILPSGYTGPVLDVSGPIDPSTHNPYLFTVVLG